MANFGIHKCSEGTANYVNNLAERNEGYKLDKNTIQATSILVFGFTLLIGFCHFYQISFVENVSAFLLWVLEIISIFGIVLMLFGIISLFGLSKNSEFSKTEKLDRALFTKNSKVNAKPKQIIRAQIVAFVCNAGISVVLVISSHLYLGAICFLNYLIWIGMVGLVVYLTRKRLSELDRVKNEG